MRKRKLIPLLAMTVIFFANCKDDKMFEVELYKNVLALISTEHYNTFQEPVELTGEPVVGYLAATSGGTLASDKDIVLKLEEDKEQFDFYNHTLHDVNKDAYARLLDKKHYEIAEYAIKIPKGSRTGITPVTLKPEGLSPDSIYFISLKIVDDPKLIINKRKKSLLYQVLIKNQYATQENKSLYEMSGFLNNVVIAGNKQMFPLTKDQVRITAGVIPFKSNVKDIKETSLVLKIDSNKVSIQPYGSIQVKMIDGNKDFPNSFHVEKAFGRTFNVFLLAYEYKIKRRTFTMFERLRMEVKP